jgi:MGT family glycosyltransferase
MHLFMAGTTAPSHVYPSLALIAELVARGHRVSYLIGDRLAELVAPTGAEVIAHPTLLPDAQTAWPEDDIGEAMQLFLDEAIAVLPRLLESERPDAVLYDIGGFAGRVAAHRWGVPAIQLSPTYVAWEGYEEDMAEFASTLKASPSGRRYYATLRGWLDANELALDADDFLGRPEACVVLIPRVIQPNEERVSERYVFAGPCIDETRTAGWTPAPGDERPRVYVSFGTAYTDLAELYQRIVDELGSDHRLVLATGKVDPATLPVGVEAARTQPQLDVLRFADVFITHAGMGGTVESLWLGVPTGALPQAVDHFTKAAQLEAIGAGVPLGERDLADAVAAALACAPRARELRAQVRASGGPAKAADAVERLLA